MLPVRPQAKDFHGVKLFPVDATGILKVIVADTAKVLASEVVDGTQTGDSIQLALGESATERNGDVRLSHAGRKRMKGSHPNYG